MTARKTALALEILDTLIENAEMFPTDDLNDSMDELVRLRRLIRDMPRGVSGEGDSS